MFPVPKHDHNPELEQQVPQKRCSPTVSGPETVSRFCTAGTPEAVYIVLACSKIGALANFVNPMFQPAQIRDRINETNAAFLFVLDKLYASVSSILSETCIRHLVVLPATASLPAPLRILAELKSPLEPELKQALHENSKHSLWSAFIKTGSSYASPTEAPYQKDTPVVMVYSSGTTGASKGIVLTNDGINATIAQYETGFPEVSRQKKFLHIVPIWFSQRHFDLSVDAPLPGSLLHSRNLYSVLKTSLLILRNTLPIMFWCHQSLALRNGTSRS